MLTRLIRIQLVLFTVLTLVALIMLGWYYLRLPSVAGIGQYTLTADLPSSGGLYRTANVTYRGITIGKVTDVEPTERGAKATMSISDHFKIPVDAVANVHSVSAIGEQYLDLVADGQFRPVSVSPGRRSPRHGAARDRARARCGEQRSGGAAEGEDRRAARRDVAGRRRARARRCSAWSTAPRRSSVTSRPTSTTSTTSSTIPVRSSTARSTPVTRSRAGRPT